jgi:hypothetical protein
MTARLILLENLTDAPREFRPQSEPHDPRAPVMSGCSARQGVVGHNVRYVLGFGLATAVIALLIVYLLFFGSHLGA